MKGDAEIIQAMRADLEKGLRLLMQERWEAIYWHIRRLVVSHDDAQDATQETFVRIFRSFHQFKGDCSLRVWMYRIATNEALRLLGKRRKDTTSIDEASMEVRHIADEAYVDYSDAEAVRLQNAILSLPAKQQLVFNLRYYDELDYEEIARIVDSSAASAKANYHIAKEKIIRILSQ